MTKSKYIIAAIILVVAVFRAPQIGFITPKITSDVVTRILFIVGATAAMGVMLSRINLWAGLLMFVCAHSFMYPIHSPLTEKALITALAGGAMFLALQEVDRDIVLNVLLIFALFQSYFLIAQSFGFGFDLYGSFKPVDTEPIGLSGNRNSAAISLALSMPAFFRKDLCYLVPVPLIGLFIAGSSGGFVAAGIAIFIFCMMSEFRFKRTVMAASIIAAIVFFTLRDTPTVFHRLSIWLPVLKNHFSHTWGDIPNQTLLGVGLGNWLVLKAMAGTAGFTHDFTRAHNTFIQGFIEMGFPFIVVLAGYAWSVIKRINRNARVSLSALGAIAMCCMVNSVFHQSAVNGMFIIMWLAVLEKELRCQKNRQPTL